jgi:hypothetical protein
MSVRQPSRLALFVFDQVVSNNEPLKGDLIEEFEMGRSQWWLWRQVVGALLRQPDLRGTRPDLLILGAAVLTLVTFEAVFVTNVMHRLLFGGRAQDLTGYLYQMPAAVRYPPAQTPVEWMLVAVCIAASVPIGWVIARFHHHYALSLIAFAVSVTSCAALNLQSLLVIQFLTMMLFVVGVLTGGRLAATLL